MSRLSFAPLALLFCGSCLIVPEGASPEVGLSTVLASQYNFRGMPNNERGVLQGEMAIDLPTKIETGVLSFKAWANVDLSNDTGDAWFPDGHGGEPSQIDLVLSYSETYRGFDITSGFVSYVLQNPDDFPRAPSGERGETKELFVSVSRPVGWDLVPSLTLHLDIDEADGLYADAALARVFPINEEFEADARISLAYSGSNPSDWTYGLDESGFADLRATGRLSYFMDAHTTIHGSLNASTIIDSDIEDWFDQIDIDSNNVWVALGVTWGY